MEEKKEEIMKCDSIVLFLSVCLKILYLETFPLNYKSLGLVMIRNTLLEMHVQRASWECEI